MQRPAGQREIGGSQPHEKYHYTIMSYGTLAWRRSLRQREPAPIVSDRVPPMPFPRASPRPGTASATPGRRARSTTPPASTGIFRAPARPPPARDEHLFVPDSAPTISTAPGWRVSNSGFSAYFASRCSGPVGTAAGARVAPTALPRKPGPGETHAAPLHDHDHRGRGGRRRGDLLPSE
jgi:hypothetical protein